jgi:hypothetical protein
MIYGTGTHTKLYTVFDLFRPKNKLNTVSNVLFFVEKQLSIFMLS